MNNDKLLLKGVKVVEFANFVAAPTAGKLLADWGAEVIKVEPLEGDSIRFVGNMYNSPMLDDENPMYETENGNKKGVCIDTRDEQGKEVLFKLLETADIFLTNVRSRSLEKSGLDYESLKVKFPHLIHAHLLGYGETGPLKDRPGFDYTAYFARGGVSVSLMEKGTSPANTAAGLGDHYAGMSLAAGMLAALYRKEKTGEGEKVTVSLLHTALFGMALMVVTAQYGNEMPLSRKAPNNPLATTYKCADDRWIQLALLQYDKWFANFCDNVIDRPDLKEVDKYNKLKNVVNYRQEFVELLEKEFIKKPIQEWMDLLEKADVPYEVLQTCNDILVDEQAWANDFLFKHTYENGNEGVLVNSPVKFGKMGIKEYVAAPRKGQHTVDILTGHGFTPEQIEILKKNNIIA